MDSIIILRFGETKVAKEEFYRTKKTLKLCDFDVNNIVFQKSFEKKTNSKYLIRYLDGV